MVSSDIENLYQYLDRNMDSYQSITGNDELEFALARWPVLYRITQVISYFDQEHTSSIPKESRSS